MYHFATVFLVQNAFLPKVLFPMLSKLLGVSNQTDTVGLEETRMRAATLLSKVVLPLNYFEKNSISIALYFVET